MSQDKINLTRLKRQSSLFDVATTSYINLINEIAACSDDPMFKQHIKAFLKHLESDISSSAERSQPSKSSGSTDHRSTSSIERSSRRSSNDQAPVACPVTEALKASSLLPPKESYHDTELAQAWSTLYLETLHLSPQLSKERLTPLQQFASEDARGAVLIFSDRDQVLIPSLVINERVISPMIKLSTDQAKAASIGSITPPFGGLSTNLLGVINTLYYLYERAPELMFAAYQPITPRGYEDFSKSAVFDQWCLTTSQLLEKLSQISTLTVDDVHHLIELDELFSSIFPRGCTPNPRSWFERFLTKLRYEIASVVRSLGIRKYNWSFTTLAMARSETSNNLLYQTSDFEPGTVLRVLRASVELPQRGARDGRVLYSSR